MNKIHRNCEYGLLISGPEAAAYDWDHASIRARVEHEGNYEAATVPLTNVRREGNTVFCDTTVIEGVFESVSRIVYYEAHTGRELMHIRFAEPFDTRTVTVEHGDGLVIFPDGMPQKALQESLDYRA